MKQGRIIKVISNQYTIYSPEEAVVATPRGRMRKGEKPLAGDIVNYETIEGSERIDSILPRRNRLLRPAVCNVDQALIVTSLKDPDFSSRLLNRLIFLVVLCDIEPVICITKSDLLTPQEKEKIDQELEWYRKVGYRVFVSNPGSDDEELKELLKGRISVLCGQSGAGKSSLLNRLDPTFHLQTQEISKALGRGKHTTRHCELHPVAGGLVADTPGFSSLDFTRMDVSSLASRLIDFAPYLEEGCRFADCIHVDEPDCIIKENVKNGNINPTLYEDYALIMKEFKNRKQY